MKMRVSLAVLSLILGACGGGGSTDSTTGDSVSGLEMPSAMEVVVADTGGGAVPIGVNLRAVRSSLMRAATDPGTDYSTDEQKAWVHDSALEPLDMVNEILCYMDQTRADQLVNQTYVALVDAASCKRQGQQDTGGQNQSSSGGHNVSYERWIVESTRADNNSPQTVRIWVPESGDDNFVQAIYAEMTIQEGVSASNPYGSFTLNFEGRATTAFTEPGSGTPFAAGDVLMTGTLKTVDTINGKIGFTLFNDSPWSGAQEVSVVTDADLSTGVAFIGGNDFDPSANGGAGGLVEKAYALAFNANNILIQPESSFAALATINNLDAATVESNGGACLSRTEFKHNVWRYDLYDATSGARVAVNSGFPFTYNGSYGWVGYWGVWAENPPVGGWDGVSITKEAFGSTATPETYGLSVAPGKLTKRVKGEILLTDLDGETFNYGKWDNTAMQNKEYKIEFDNDGAVSDGTNANYTVAGFYITHEVQYQQDGPPLETALTGGPQLITFDQVGDDPWLGMWSQSLGGSVSYDFNNNPTNVTFYKETFIDANDTAFGSGNSITLNCYTECLKPELTVAQYTDQQYPSSAFYADAADGSSPAPAAVYSFDRTTLALTVVEPTADVGKVVSLAETYTYDPMGGGFEPWGVATGALVPSGNSIANKWDTWNQQVSYRWETGHQDWNKVVIVTDSTGSVVSFDPPLSFSYQHASGNDANAGTGGAGTAAYGKTFLLEYAGNGDLWGIPWVDNGSGNSRPAFAIADGTVMGPNGTEYVIKAREMELKPALDTGACSGVNGLVLNQPAASLPTAVDGSPSNGGSTAPALDDNSPAAIGGVVQGS